MMRRTKPSFGGSFDLLHRDTVSINREVSRNAKQQAGQLRQCVSGAALRNEVGKIKLTLLRVRLRPMTCQVMRSLQKLFKHEWISFESDPLSIQVASLCKDESWETLIRVHSDLRRHINLSAT